MILNTDALRASSPAVLTTWQMVATVVFAVPVLISSVPQSGGSLNTVLLGGSSMSMFILIGMLAAGTLLWATMCCRTIGLQRATSSTVATLLYTEIAWSFLFDVVFNSVRPDGLQLTGAALIISGAAVYALATRPAPAVHSTHEMSAAGSTL